MAYGQNAPFGLRPLHNLHQNTLTSQTRTYQIYASANGKTTSPAPIFTGDPVTFSSQTITPIGGSATSMAGTIYPYQFSISIGSLAASAYTFGTGPVGGGAATAQALLGVFAGCQYTATNGQLVNSPYWPGGGTQVLAGTQINAFVWDDPNIVYDIQVSSPTSVWQNACFPNAGIVTAAGNNGSATYRLVIGANAALDFINPGAWAAPTAGATWATQQNPGYAFTYANNTVNAAPYAAAGAYTSTGGNTFNGQSGYYLSGGTALATAGQNVDDYQKTGANSTSLPLKIVGVTPNPQNLALYNAAMQSSTIPGANSNAYNTSTPFLNVSVILNNHIYSAPTAGTTVA